jgi:hypothetical protein
MQLHRPLAALTLAAFLSLSLQAPAFAGAIGTRDLLAAGSAAGAGEVARFDRGAALARVQATLNRDDIRQALEARGVAADAAAARVAALSDQELANLASQLDEAPAGGSLLGVIGVVFVVLLILELTGVIDIFKKI